MNPHPYLRAYMAGVAVPTVFLLAVFAGFCVVRFGYNPEFPIERVLVFPLALAVSRALGFEFPVNGGAVVLIAAPLVMILYYVLWKYVVGWLNEVLGIA